MNVREKIVLQVRQLGMPEMANAIAFASAENYPTYLVYLTSSLYGYEASLLSVSQEQPSMLRPEAFMRKQRLVRELRALITSAEQALMNSIARHESMLPIEVA